MNVLVKRLIANIPLEYLMKDGLYDIRQISKRLYSYSYIKLKQLLLCSGEDV